MLVLRRDDTAGVRTSVGCRIRCSFWHLAFLSSFYVILYNQARAMSHEEHFHDSKPSPKLASVAMGEELA